MIQKFDQVGLFELPFNSSDSDFFKFDEFDEFFVRVHAINPSLRCMSKIETAQNCHYIHYGPNFSPTKVGPRLDRMSKTCNSNKDQEVHFYK